MLRRYCGSCRSPCTPMTVTASAFPAWGNPMQMPRSLALIVLTARASVSPLSARGSLSFQRATPPLAPSRFLPPREEELSSAGRRRPATRPSHAGPLQRSLDAPTLQLNRRLRRSTLWWFYRSIRPNSSLP